MKLSSLKISRYRSLREETIHLSDLNVLIGTNASGKSTILDALRFLHEGVLARDFREAVFSRGRFIHLAWKGEDASETGLSVRVDNDGKRYEWTVRLHRDGYGFFTEEHLNELPPSKPPVQLLTAVRGEGWWWSGKREEQVPLKQDPTACAQWYLEAWYFADACALEGYLARNLDSVDTSKPDEIQNPKQHLKILLADRVYTAVISEEIAARLSAATIADRSPSFRGMLAAIRNGETTSQWQE